MGKISIPAGLSEEAMKLFRRTRAEYGLAPDVVFMLLLENCCRTLDRLRQAESLLEREGLTYQDRFNRPKTHPAAARVDRESATLEKQITRLKGQISTAKYSRTLKAGTRHD